MSFGFTPHFGAADRRATQGLTACKKGGAATSKRPAVFSNGETVVTAQKKRRRLVRGRRVVVTVNSPALRRFLGIA